MSDADRMFDLLVLDYAGVCTLSTSEFLANASMEPEALGERVRSVSVIRNAQLAGLRVVVLSNEIDRSWIAGSPVLSQVDHVLACSDNGIYKPDRRAFQRALLATQCQPARALAVDDDPANIRGAQAAGLATLLFDVSNPDASWLRIDAAIRRR